MVEGMEKEQFLKFRMSLLPASGFQSGQYRLIEIYSTDFNQLVIQDKRLAMQHQSEEEQFKHIYWKFGATELASGKQTLTLRQFEKKYAAEFITLAKNTKNTNFRALLRNLTQAGNNTDELENELRQLDTQINVTWPLVHFKSAVKYLHRQPEEIKATGGTNWQKYLPPRFQKRIFYPELWTQNQIEEWGRNWVMSVLSTL